MDHRLVVRPARSRCSEILLHPAKPTRRPRGRQLRPPAATNQNSTQGAQGRLAPLRAKLLPPVPSGRSPCGAGRHVHQPRRLSLCCQKQERVMNTSDRETKDKSGPAVLPRKISDATPDDGSLSRRNILFGSTALAAASAMGSVTPTEPALAQPAP